MKLLEKNVDAKTEKRAGQPYKFSEQLKLIIDSALLMGGNYDKQQQHKSTFHTLI